MGYPQFASIDSFVFITAADVSRLLWQLSFPKSKVLFLQHSNHMSFFGPSAPQRRYYPQPASSSSTTNLIQQPLKNVPAHLPRRAPSNTSAVLCTLKTTTIHALIFIYSQHTGRLSPMLTVSGIPQLEFPSPKRWVSIPSLVTNH